MEKRTSDRRQVVIDFKRRNYDRRLKTFNYPRTIHLSDTNAFGSVYFARFFDLQGEAREEFLLHFMGAELTEFTKQGFALVTLEANCKYKLPLFVYDRITVKLQVLTLKRTKAHLSFIIEKASGEIAAEGEQWLAFTDHQGKAIPIPKVVLKNVKRFVVASE